MCFYRYEYLGKLGDIFEVVDLKLFLLIGLFRNILGKNYGLRISGIFFNFVFGFEFVLFVMIFFIMEFDRFFFI